MWDDQPNTEQVLLRLPKPMVEALIHRSGELAMQRLERVSVQMLIREVLNRYLRTGSKDIHLSET